MGFRLGAEFLAAVGDPDLFTSPDQLAAYAGLAPVPHDSGKRTGRLQRPPATTADCDEHCSWPP